MRILVTGASGFVGRHFLNEAALGGHETFALDLSPPHDPSPCAGFATANLTDPAALREAVQRFSPDACLHLAGIAFVPAANSDPSGIININVMGTTHLLEAFRTTAPNARILVVSSSHVYGQANRPAPITEDDPLAPDTLYSITKAAADSIARFYSRQYGMKVIVARPGNHVGPGQSPSFVIPAFARQVKAIRQGTPQPIKVGNLESVRDFTDVRDVARAYRLLLEQGQSGLAYNIASGHQYSIGTILDRLCTLAGIKPEIVQDPALYRPDGVCPRLDTHRLTAATGWQPAYTIEKTLADILESA